MFIKSKNGAINVVYIEDFSVSPLRAGKHEVMARVHSHPTSQNLCVCAFDTREEALEHIDAIREQLNLIGLSQ